MTEEEKPNFKGLKKVTETFYALRNGIDIPVDPTCFPKEYWVHATVYEKIENINQGENK
jgi:hypothetical protein